MDIQEINEIIMNLKKKYGKLYSNIIWTSLCNCEIEVVHTVEAGLIIIAKKRKHKNAFYAVADVETFKELMNKVESGVALEYQYIGVNDMHEYIMGEGFEHYANYVRIIRKHDENPYGVETGRRRILAELYDSSMGNYAELSDIPELAVLTKEAFDEIGDDVFTDEEWNEIIENKQCMIAKDEGRIIAYHVWRIEGKKAYFNVTLNVGPANYLYNLERKVFEDIWEKGIRITYAWYREDNVRALKRSSVDVDAKGALHNAIYIKK